MNSTVRQLPFLWPRRFFRLSSNTTARTISTTKNTAAKDAVIITRVVELSSSPFCPSRLGTEVVVMESANIK